MIKIASWNVNSVRSRLEHLLEYLRSDDAPDILLLQELKCMTEAFPYEQVEDTGYNVAVHGQKTYNGVAILSKFPIDDVIKQLPGDENDEQARYIEAVICANEKTLRVASIYVPNGQSPDSDKFQYKMRFFDRLYAHAKNLLAYDEALILGGDYNVAPYEKDVFDPQKINNSICYHPEERKKLRELQSLGLVDIYHAMYPEKQQFTWWDYRAGAWQQNKGYRIDHLMLSAEAADLAEKSGVDMFMRDKQKPSDHAPIWCKFNC